VTDSAKNAALNGVAPLPHLGVIQVDGEDAAKFIHGQLTQDFSLLGMDAARLAAFCSPKGRMQASFIGLKRSAGVILLVCSRDILPATLKRITMFVMRAKARLRDASTEYTLYGLAGNAIQNIAGCAQSTWAKTDLGDISVVNLYPADGIARQLWIAPTGTPPPNGAPMDPALWAWSEVRSGVATLSAPVVEEFVPQMLNYESVGGVNFKKGCYPGQEVVARSQFRGTLKRRAFLVHCEAPLVAGDAVYVPSDSEQPVATVVQAAPAPGGGFDAIISGQIAAVNEGPLHAGAIDGGRLLLQALPYALLEDI
jgi:folate-binding protein YgfZ